MEHSFVCTLCPRNCSASRTPTAGGGHCRMPALPKVARAALHHWEEPVISGRNGSGTVFFSGCSLDCVFCQNHNISHGDIGQTISVEHLAALCRNLVWQGAHNINLVNPTHYAHILPQSLADIKVPVVWNSGGYDRVETVEKMSSHVQVWLPDLKYITPQWSGLYSGATDYPQIATAAIAKMVEVAGPPIITDGILTRGVLIRHLLLPGHLAEAKLVMDWVSTCFPPGHVLFSLMGQYTPLGRAADFPALNRLVRPSELRAAQQYMKDLGLEGFSQEGTSATTEYIPDFNLGGVINVQHTGDQFK